MGAAGAVLNAQLGDSMPINLNTVGTDTLANFTTLNGQYSPRIAIKGLVFNVAPALDLNGA